MKKKTGLLYLVTLINFSLLLFFSLSVIFANTFSLTNVPVGGVVSVSGIKMVKVNNEGLFVIANPDTTPPINLTFTPDSAAVINPATIEVAFFATDDGLGVSYYQYCVTVDDSVCTPSLIGNNVVLAGINDYRICVRAIDKIGNNSLTTCSDIGDFKILPADTTPPTAPTLSPTARAWGNTNVVVSFSGSTDDESGFSHYQYCSTTATSCTPNTNGSSVTLSSNGEYVVCARAVDNASNVSTTTCSADKAYKIDKTVPTAPALSPTARAWGNTNVVVSFSGSTDAGGAGFSHYQYCSTTATSCTPNTNGSSVTLSSNGEYVVCARAVDNASNVSTTTCSADKAYKIDKTAPNTVNMTPATSTVTSPSTISISLSATDNSGGSGISYYQYCTTTNGATCTPSTSGSSITLSGINNYRVCARAVDNATNIGSTVCSLVGDYKIESGVTSGCQSTCNVSNPSPFNGDMQNFTTTQCNAVPTPTGTGCTLVGTMRDSRDNKTYEVRKLSDGKCWMVDNLAYGGATDNCASKTTFSGTGSTAATHRFGFGTYGDCRNNPGTNYGYLYNWQAAMQHSTAYYDANYTGPTTNVQGLCPTGWILPTGGYYTGGDFGTLHTAAGSPDSGFWQGCAWKGPMSGRCMWGGALTLQGSDGFWWSSTPATGSNPDAHHLRYFTTAVFTTVMSYKDYGFSIRCIKQ